MTWLYQGQLFDTAPEDCQGFVYMITNLALNRRYIGKKNFWSVKKLPPLKGRKNKRHKRVETDWHTYWGSNEQLQLDVKHLGKDSFRREILYLCSSKSWMSYHETRLHFELGVLLTDDWYNGIINCRINKNSLKKA